MTEKLSHDAKHVLISVNPRAGSGSRQDEVDRLAGMLAGQSFIPEVITSRKKLKTRVDELRGDGRLRVVVGAGGDGTLHELFNLVPAGVPLAMLPLGTENLLAKYLGQKTGPEPLSRMIADGYIERLDAGRAGERLFLLMASCGFDAEVARRLHESRPDNIRHTHYIKPILSAIRNYNYPTMQITLEMADGTEQTIDACWCFVFNLPEYGFRMPFAPHSDGRDGRLNVCTFRQGSLWQALRYTAHLYLQRHERLADCTTAEVVRVRIESDQPVPYQMDGDPGGWLPLDLDVVPERLTLLVRKG